MSTQTTQNLLDLKIHKLSKEQFEQLDSPESTALYLIPEQEASTTEAGLMSAEDKQIVSRFDYDGMGYLTTDDKIGANGGVYAGTEGATFGNSTGRVARVNNWRGSEYTFCFPNDEVTNNVPYTLATREYINTLSINELAVLDEPEVSIITHDATEDDNIPEMGIEVTITPPPLYGGCTYYAFAINTRAPIVSKFASEAMQGAKKTFYLANNTDAGNHGCGIYVVRVYIECGGFRSPVVTKTYEVVKQS